MKRILAILAIVATACGGSSKKSDGKPVKGDKMEQTDDDASDDGRLSNKGNDDASDDDQITDDDDVSNGDDLVTINGTEVDPQGVIEHAEAIMEDEDLLDEFEAEHELTEYETKAIALFWLMIAFSEEEPEVAARLAAIGIAQEVQEIALQYPESLGIEMTQALRFQTSGDAGYTCDTNCLADFKLLSETIIRFGGDKLDLVKDLDIQAIWVNVKGILTGLTIFELKADSVINDGLGFDDAVKIIGLVADTFRTWAPRALGPVGSIAWAWGLGRDYGKAIYACTDWKDRNCNNCWNGIVDPGETCDIGSCVPESICVPEELCQTAEYSGAFNKCTAECKITEITTCINDDECCAPGCDHTTDNDCYDLTVCGDGKLDADEECEHGINDQYGCDSECKIPGSEVCSPIDNSGCEDGQVCLRRGDSDDGYTFACHPAGSTECSGTGTQLNVFPNTTRGSATIHNGSVSIICPADKPCISGSWGCGEPRQYIACEDGVTRCLDPITNLENNRLLFCREGEKCVVALDVNVAYSYDDDLECGWPVGCSDREYTMCESADGMLWWRCEPGYSCGEYNSHDSRTRCVSDSTP